MTCIVCHRPLRTTTVRPNLTVTLPSGKSEPNSTMTLGKNDAILLTKIPLCKACKKFYWRSQKQPFSSKTCVCKSLKVGAKLDITKCKPCRFRRCQEAFGDDVSKLKPSEESSKGQKPTFKLSKEAFSKIPCAVCHSPSSGIHYGVFACGACSAFFRRWAIGPLQKTNCEVPTNKDGSYCTSDKCRSCRFARCVSAGMSIQHRCGGRLSRQRYEAVCSAIAKNEGEHAVTRRRTVKRKVSETSTSQYVGAEDSGNASETLESSFDSTLSTVDGVTSTESPESRNCSSSSTASSTCSESANEEPSGSTQSSEEIKDYESSEMSVDRSDAGGIEQHWISQSQDFWNGLTNRTVEAVSLLATIASVRVVLKEEMPQEQIAALKSESFAIYLKCVGEFLKNLPGMENIGVTERVSIYLESFFPILVAELSLTFDVSNQVPNTLSLHRNGDWRIIDASIEAFLVEAGNRMAAVVTNIEEFSLLCALLCFPDTSSNAAVSSIGRCFKLAALQHLLFKGLSERNLLVLLDLASFLRQANFVLRRYAEELTSQSSLLSSNANNADTTHQTLVSQFCEQFLSKTNVQK